MCLALPGRVIAVEDGQGVEKRGLVDFDGVRLQVNLDLVPETQEGDYVIVHVGFAISRLDEAAALETLRYLREIGQS
jgi:hydrogenase expression/formation protein HypC